MTTSFFPKRLIVTVIAIAFGCPTGCGLAPDTGNTFTKKDASRLSKTDWSSDYCLDLGWYQDDICDLFCPNPDPDCGFELPTDRRPYCGRIGTSSEGWYWGDTDERIAFAICEKTAEPDCGWIATDAEGWYSSGTLIIWDTCHRLVGISIQGEPCGETAGLSCNQGLYCARVFSGDGANEDGICQANGSCETAADCLIRANDWSHFRCMGYSRCESNQCVWYCGVPNDDRTAWTTVQLTDVESDHPYADNTERTWVVRRDGASRIKIHFSRLEIEADGDTLSVQPEGDETNALVLEGRYSNFWSPELDGDTIVVTLRSDQIATEWGFRVDAVSYLEILPANRCHQTEDCDPGMVCEPRDCGNPYAPCYGDCLDGQPISE